MFNFIAAPLAFAVSHTNPPAQTQPQVGSQKSTTALDYAFAWSLESFAALGAAIGQIVSLFTWIGGKFFDIAVDYNINFVQGKLGAIIIGWGIVRDITNIFFVLIILGIAISTILRIQGYQAKALLPKLIIIALLINFSLTIGLVIIDFSNILALQFYDKLRPNKISISETINQITRPQNFYNINAPPKDQQLTFELQKPEEATPYILQNGSAPNNTQNQAPAALQNGLWSGTISRLFAGSPEASAVVATAAWGNTIMLSILVFVFFVGGVLLLVRAAILGFLLVLAPLAFLFYILPDTETHWKKWWSTFIQHVFFFPSFLFLLYVAVKFVGDATKGIAASEFLSNPSLVFTYLLAIIMLLTALILGRSMGVYGAATAMNWATSGRKWLTGFVGGVAARNTLAPIGERLKPLANRVTRASPWLGTYARGAQEWLAKRGGARDMAEDQAKAALAQAKGTWGASFGKGTLPMRVGMLKGMDEKTRGEFLATLPGPLRKTADNIIASPQFTSAEQKGLAKSRMQYEINQAQLQGNLSNFMAGKSDEDAQKYFGAMSENQKTAWLEEGYGNPATLNKFAKLTTAQPGPEGGLSLEDQEKFRQSLRSASGPAVSAYVEKLTGDARKDARTQTLKALSPEQLAYLYTEGDDAKRTELDGLTKTLAPDVQQKYNDAAAKMLNQKPSADLIAALPSLSDDMTASFIRSRGVDNTIDLINDTATLEPVKRKLFGGIKKAGLSGQYAKKLDPITKVKYLDYDESKYENPNDFEKDTITFTEAVAVEVKNSTARELAQRTSAKIIRDKNFKNSLLKGASIAQLAALTDTPAKSAALKEILIEAAEDKNLSADNIAKQFKAKNLSIQLGEQLANLRRRQKEMMNQPERLLYSQIFGDLEPERPKQPPQPPPRNDFEEYKPPPKP